MSIEQRKKRLHVNQLQLSHKIAFCEALFSISNYECVISSTCS